MNNPYQGLSETFADACRKADEERQREHKGNGAAGSEQPRLETHVMSDLESKTFDPLQWIIPNYIPEGVTLLAGKPKIGKSWLVLGTALGRGEGTSVLDQVCPKGDVLYCALEDNERRMKERTTILLAANSGWPGNVHIAYKLNDLDHGCIEQLLTWVRTHPSISLIIIDTLANIRGRRAKDEDQYQCDYRTMKALLDFSRQIGISIIVVHHVRKATAEDVFDTISGTNGFSAVADTLVVLTRNDDQLRLATRGRDAPPEDKVVDFDQESGAWSVLNDYEPEDRGATQTNHLIIAALGPKDYPSTPAAVAKMTNLPEGTVRQALRRLARNGKIGKGGYGSYYAL
jgi:predicted ATP-dependent serine protease